ncbi:hypothetical protein HDU79_003548 [Rhizoclosmatium sp. JEL0117]|nr:hypothetical protein HDU79_003548 [Rhizoclosmatium sp. JEL0117]
MSAVGNIEEHSGLAVVILPTSTPENSAILSAINQIRASHDRVYDKWPAHLTLVPPPQLPPSQVTAAQLCTALTPIADRHKSLEISLDTVSILAHKQGASIVLEPSQHQWDAITSLQSDLSSLLPARSNVPKERHAFRPHLTLASLRDAADAEALAAEILGLLEATEGFPLRVDVSAVSVMAKGSGKDAVYSCVGSVPLGVRNSVETAPALSTSRMTPESVSTNSFAFNIGSQQWEAATPPTSSSTQLKQLRIVTYNVLNDPEHPTNYSATDRFETLLNTIEDCNADVIGLQEVGIHFLTVLTNTAWVQERYFLSIANVSKQDDIPTGIVALSKVPFRCNTIALSKGKRAVIITPYEGLKIGVVHLTSDYNGNKASLRGDQWRALMRFMGDAEAIVVGDFNSHKDVKLDNAFSTARFSDVWTDVNPEAEGFTYDPVHNQLAEQTTRRGVQGRYDRVLLRSAKFSPVSCWLLGDNSVEDYSDHYGVCCDVESVRAAAQSTPVQAVKLNASFDDLAKDAIADPSMYEFLCSKNAIPDESDYKRRMKALEKLQVLLGLCFNPAPFHFSPVGSFALGINTPSSDIDVLCVSMISPRDLFSILRGDKYEFQWPEDCKLLRIVDTAKVPLIELLVCGVKVDLQYGCFIWSVSDKSVGGLDDLCSMPVMTQQSRQLLCSYLDYRRISGFLEGLIEKRRITDVTERVRVGAQFRLATRFLKVWAKKRGVDDVKMGYPPSHTLTVLLVKLMEQENFGHELTASLLVARFFRYYGFEVDWSLPIDCNNDSVARGCVDERNPMFVWSSGVNICRGVVASSRDVWINELKRAGSCMSDLSVTAEPYHIMDSSSFVHIEACAPSLVQLSKLKKLIELLFVNLVVQIQRRCPSISVRPFGEWLVLPENDPETSASLVMGLTKKDSTVTLTLAEKKQVLATLENVLSNFVTDVQRMEDYGNGMWMNASHVQQSAIKALVPAPSLEVSLETESAHSEKNVDMENCRDTAPIVPRPQSNANVFKSGKLRSSEDVFNRILWDNTFEREYFVIGYMDRFTGMQELSFNDFAIRKADQQGEDWIPFHRVWYFKEVKKGGERLMWDRKTKTDLIFS